MVLAAVSSAVPQTKKPAPESWYHRIARFLGVDRTPVALKGPSSATAGELWVTPADSRAPRAIATGGAFSSPVFQPGGKYVFALQDARLVRVPVAGGAPVPLRDLTGVVKIIGFDQKDPDALLGIFSAGAPPMFEIAVVSLKTGKRIVVASQQPPTNIEVGSLLGWQRSYGKIQVLPIGNEIVVRGVKAFDVPVTNCGDSAACGQPAYSPELNLVVYVRTAL
jgi:hypothetical protein